MKSNVRHHAVHPPINVKPSAVNKKPGTYTPAEKAGGEVSSKLTRLRLVSLSLP